MEKILDFAFLFLIAYPFAGLLIVVLHFSYRNHPKAATLEFFVEVINIFFGICLLLMLINSFLVSKIDNGYYFFSDWRDWLWDIPVLLVISLLMVRKVRINAFSVLLYSLILFIGFYIASSFDYHICV